MIKFIVLAVLLAAGSSFSLLAQNCSNNFLGTKTLYKKPDVKYSRVPLGYQSVFINHVGRHGARHLTKNVNTTLIYKKLFYADSIHALTNRGQKLLNMVKALNKVETGTVKSISAEGILEQEGLGKRMYSLNRSVFKNYANINVATTKEIRTKQSADAFLKGLKQSLTDSAVFNQFDDDTDLRFYDMSPAYKKFERDGKWVSYNEQFKKTEHFENLNQQIVSTFFSSAYLKTLSPDDREQFINDLFGFATIVSSLRAEIKLNGLQPSDLDFKQFFVCLQLKTLEKTDLVEEYYKKGPGMDVNGIQIRIAVPLLIDFIKTSDRFITQGKINAQLRFAHAETIAPIAALMNITVADKSTSNVFNVNKFWQASSVVPLSANIQWVFYKKACCNDYLVKVLLNEKEVHITGMGNTRVYYQWKDLRKFYINKLQALNVNLDDDMKNYLTDLK